MLFTTLLLLMCAPKHIYSDSRLLVNMTLVRNASLLGACMFNSPLINLTIIFTNDLLLAQHHSRLSDVESPNLTSVFFLIFSMRTYTYIFMYVYIQIAWTEVYQLITCTEDSELEFTIGFFSLRYFSLCIFCYSYLITFPFCHFLSSL